MKVLNLNLKTFCIIMLLLSVWTGNSTLNAQHVFPDHSDEAQWNVFECIWPECHTKTYNYELDTVFCGQLYSKVHFSHLNENGYFRSENLKTFFRMNSDCSEKEYLIYDYSLEVGDTAFVGFNLFWNEGQDTTEFVVDMIDTVNHFGVDRKRMKMKYDPHNQGDLIREMYWLNGIGSETHPFYPFQCLMDGCENGFQLLCYDSLAIQLYQNPWANDCDTSIILGLSDLKDLISIEPNPFDQLLQINTDGLLIYEIEFYSSIGDEILIDRNFQGTTITLNTGKLKPGTYFVKITTNHGVHSKPVIKI
jgi:hypothetical protein